MYLLDMLKTMQYCADSNPACDREVQHQQADEIVSQIIHQLLDNPSLLEHADTRATILQIITLYDKIDHFYYC